MIIKNPEKLIVKLPYWVVNLLYFKSRLLKIQSNSCGDEFSPTWSPPDLLLLIIPLCWWNPHANRKPLKSNGKSKWSSPVGTRSPVRVAEPWNPVMPRSHASLKKVPPYRRCATLTMIDYTSCTDCILLSWNLMEKNLWRPSSSYLGFSTISMSTHLLSI